MSQEHVLYDPAKCDFMRDDAGDPVITTNMPVEKPAPGLFYMQLGDIDSTTEIAAFDETRMERYDPEIKLVGLGSACRVWKIRMKAS
jgi:hypothetical protein